MGKWKMRKLSHKVACFCTAFAVILSVCVAMVGYYMYQKNLVARYQAYADTALQMALSAFDGEEIAQCIATGEENEGYAAARQMLCTIRENSHVSYIYAVYFPYGEPRQMAFVMNGYTQADVEAYGEQAIVSRLGELCGEGDFDDQMRSRFWAALHGGEPAETGAEYIVNDTGEYGYQMTAFVPVTDRQGNGVCILATDVSMQDIKTNLHTYTVTVAAVCAVLLAVFLGLAIYICNRSLVRPVLRLANSARDFVEQTKRAASPGALRFEKVSLSGQDEVRMLADSVGTMTDELRAYMEHLQQITAEKERIDAELNVATAIQSSMLPCIFPTYTNRREFAIDASMTPAKEVGGDFYDIFMVDERHLAVVVADVSGKGVPAALFMVIGKTLIKDHTTPGRDLGAVFTEVNRILCESNREELFITAFEGVLDLETGLFSYVNAGHEPPFLSTQGQGFALHTVRPGFVLAGLDTVRYRAGQLQMQPGDKLFLYTDGIPEATNGDQALYGLQRLEKVLASCGQLSPETILETVQSDVARFVGGAVQFDDITMLCLQYKARLERQEGCACGS